MESYIIPMLLGIFCIVLGVLNTKGNIRSVHSYHRPRISQENILPFGRLVGAGMITVGASIVQFNILSIIADALKNELFSIVGGIICTVGVVVGLALNLYAIIKYNKGLF